MRKAFHEELDRVTERLVEMTRLAGSAMARATTALLDADVQLAESVIAADAEIDALREELECSLDCSRSSSRSRPTCAWWSRRCG